MRRIEAVLAALATQGAAWREASWGQPRLREPHQEPPRHSSSPRDPSRRLRRTAGLVLLVVGLLFTLSTMAFLGYANYASWQASNLVGLAASPSIEVARIKATATSAEAQAVTIASAKATTMASAEAAVPAPKILLPPNRLRIPSIDLDAKVVEVDTREENGQLVWEVASHAAGHYRTTALPGQRGNIVMSGHVSSLFEGAVFQRLADVRVGDVVVVESGDDVFPYRVISRDIVPPDAVDMMEPTPTETLTLLTCYPDFVYSHRLVVRAVPVEDASDSAQRPVAPGVAAFALGSET